MKKLINLLIILFAAAFLFSGCQQGGEEESESFKKYGQEFEGKIAKSYEDSEEWWPTPPKPPEGTPNVVILLLDDTGFGHFSSFGGLVETLINLQMTVCVTITFTQLHFVHHQGQR